MESPKRRKLGDSSFVPGSSGPSPEDVVALLEGSPGKATSGGEMNLDGPSLTAALNYLADVWTSPPSAEGHTNMAQVAADRFGVGPQFAADELVSFGPAGLMTLYKKKQFALVRLRYHLVRNGVMDLEGDDLAGASVRASLIRIHECMKRLYDCLLTNLLTHKALDPLWATDGPAGIDPYYIMPFDLTKVKGRKAAIMYVGEALQRQALRRYRGACWIEIDSPPRLVDGVPKTFKTHSWRRYCDIDEFVERCTPKETHFGMWDLLNEKDYKSYTIKHFKTGFENEFPDLIPDRHWHAFANGLYHTARKTFFEYGDRRISPDVVACKYHDVEFPTEIMDLSEWQDIPTPYFHRILATQLEHVLHLVVDDANVPQKYSEAEAAAENAERAARELAREAMGLPPLALGTVVAGDKKTVLEGPDVIEWAYVFLGRLLYEVNQRDCWQVMPMFVGRAGTGKSLILSTVAKFFDEADVAVVANDQQKGFGLETVYDKYMWMVKEVKHDFAIDQAQLQSMITGEEMSIMRKNQTALQVVWKAPGILAGNEIADWQDNSGSMSRRMVLFRFTRKVINSDPNMAERLRRELPALMHKCNRAYANAVKSYGSCDIWAKDPEYMTWAKSKAPGEAWVGSKTVLPSYFHKNKESLKQQTHLMENFLANKDEVLVVGLASNLGMPFENDHDGRPSFKSLANAYFKKQDVKGGFLWSKTDRYFTIFEDYNIEVRPLTQRDVQLGLNRYMEHEYKIDTKWIFGVLPKAAADS